MAGDDALLHRVLRPGERLLWTGEATLRPFTRLDAVLVPLALGLFGVSLLAFVTSISAGPVRLFFLGQVVVVAAHLAFGRILVRLDRRQRAVYALTDHRAIEAVDGTSLTWRSAPLTRPLAIHVDTDGDVATVRFGPETAGARFLRSSGLLPIASTAVQFDHVADGTGVARMAEKIVAFHADRRVAPAA